MLPNGVRFESAGSGTLQGRRIFSRYTAKYQNGASSSGECAGTVSPDAARIDMACTDTLLGSFSSVSARE